MKKFLFIILLSALTTSVFSQQFLWSTIENDTLPEKYILLEDVAEKVLEYYDHYNYYYDGTGFTKEEFIIKMSDGKDEVADSWINEIDALTVLAMKVNIDYGSAIMIMIISKENADMVSFTNYLDIGAENATPYKRQKFEKWFKTLLN